MDINLFKFKLLIFSSRSIITQSDFKKAIYPEIVSTLLLHSKKTKQRVFILLENDTADGESNYMILETYNIETQEPYADNITFDSQAGYTTSVLTDDIIDFTERNPFGEIDEQI